MNQAPQTRVVQKATQVLLGQPANYPAEMVSALTILLAKHRGVKAAYLCLMHDESTQEKPSLVVGFEGEGLERAMQEAGSVTADTAPKGQPVDFIKVVVGDKGLSSYRSEEHTSELQSLMRISYAVFCLKNKKQKTQMNIQ